MTKGILVDWADLVTLDLSQFDSPGGKQKLANQLRDAVHQIGFFYITGFGLSQEQVDRQFAIGRDIFDLPEEEKLKYRADIESGDYNGYLLKNPRNHEPEPKGSIELFPGLRDNVEMYNVCKFIPGRERSQPDVVARHRDEIEAFQRHITSAIVGKLLALIALVLELPETHFVPGHRYADLSDCHLRYMVYRARTPAENARYGNLYSRAHTDFGSLTLLFRQPVAALQVRVPTEAGGNGGDGGNGGEGDGDAGKGHVWKWVKPQPESITVNIADALEFWTGGYLRSSVHRVVAPPADQAHLDRLGLLYFVRPALDMDLKVVESPLLERLGVRRADDATAGIRAGDWVKTRVKQNWDRAVEEPLREKEVLRGVKVRVYD